MLRKEVLAIVMLGFVIPSAFARQSFDVGDCIRLKVQSNLGVPVHPAAGNNVVSDRLAHGATAKITAKDQATGWFQIAADAVSGWIITKYIDAEIACASPTPSTPTPAATSFAVGTWNLEHFHEGAARGFPENTYEHAGPSYGSRTQQDYETVASIIESIGARILVLEEINAAKVTVDGESAMRSAELDRLITILGTSNYGYAVSESGDAQHIAILYDKRAVRLNAVCETDFPNQEVGGKSLFDRQPLFAHFTAVNQGQDMNDLVVVGVHLASGQQLTENHDEAMQKIVEELDVARSDGRCIPADEHDILIAGDFNASRFDTMVESFWADLEAHGWDVLADSATTYSPTRLAGVPLQPKSVIDYIIVTKGGKGLAGEEVTDAMATVHTDLVGNPDSFRQHASDHIPVTVQIKRMPDTDH